MDIQQLRCFVTAADHLHFGRAAQAMDMLPASLGRQIRLLEQRLETRLFHRTTRALTPTEIGQAYYTRVSRILADIEETEQSIGHLQGAPRGRLKINAPMSFGYSHLAPALPDFLSANPEIEVDLVMNDRTVDLIEEGFDVAVRIGRLADSSLVAKRIAPMRLAVCASPGYLAERGTPATPADLKNHCCLLYSNDSAPEEWRFTTPEGAAWPVTVKGRLCANNGDALRHAALKGVGVVRLPSFIIGQDLQAGALVSLLSDYIIQDSALYAIYPEARHLSPKVRAFVDFLGQRFGPHPYWDLVQ